MEGKKDKRQKKSKIKINEINDLSQSAVLQHKIKLEPHNIDMPDYIDDFLQISPDAIFINGNKTESQKKKKIKKIIKKKIKKISINNRKENQNKINKSSLYKGKFESRKIKYEELESSKEYNDDSARPFKEIKDIKINPLTEKIDKEKYKIITTISNNELNSSERDKRKISQTKSKYNGIQLNNRLNKSKKIKNEQEIEKRIAFLEKFNIMVRNKIFIEIISSFKILYFYKKLKNYQINSSTKITSVYRGYFYRGNLKLNYLIQQILKFRDLCCSKIIARYKGYNIRKLSQAIIQKKEDYYIIYSSLSNNKMLYFKIRYASGLEDNIYFEFCKLLKCFIFYISRKEKNISKKKIEGFFYNEKYNKLKDDMYEQNQKGENVLNFPKILKKNDENNENYDKIINEYIKDHRQVKKKRDNLEEYEERKKKALDDDIILNNKKFSEKLNKMSRSKSFMRLKGIMKCKGILKPSKSYINLKSDDKKIQFGKAKIKGYHNFKK